MKTIEEALLIVQSQEYERNEIYVPLDKAIGYTLSKDITADFDMPSFDNSAMDGYALGGISDDYTIVGEIAAGPDQSLKLKKGEAARIFTGAPIPMGCTAVMMQERCNIKNNKLHVLQTPVAGQSIRKRGTEFSKGTTVLKSGFTNTPASIGLLGSLGITQIPVFSKPKIHIITTGNELVVPGQTRLPGQIFESNSAALIAACNQHDYPCEKSVLVPDHFGSIKKSIKNSLDQTDLLILSGGISVGDYDYVKQALEENGVVEQFYKVFQKPGKPLYFGRYKNKFVFALPGNPASSLTCFYIYVLPLLQKWSGSSTLGLRQVQVTLGHDFTNKFDRPVFLKASIADHRVQILEGQGSSMLKSMADCNAILHAGAQEELKKGQRVKCYLL